MARPLKNDTLAHMSQTPTMQRKPPLDIFWEDIKKRSEEGRIEESLTLAQFVHSSLAIEQLFMVTLHYFSMSLSFLER